MYMEYDDNLKEDLIKALRSSDYEVEIQEPNNVILREKDDGSCFLVMRGDDAKFGVMCGCCIVSILGHSFTCDFNYGEWSAEDDEDCWLLEEEDFINALESADGVISGEQTDLDSQAMVYCRANNLPNDLPAYWEDDDLPE